MKRNKFSLSHYKLLTCDMGKLVPITMMDALPGDTFQQSSSLLIRVNQMLRPVMHPVRCRVHHWFVPLRLIWEDFEDFITGGEDGLDASVHPSYNAGSVAESGLLDYLGVPPATYSPNLSISALPMRAYQLIWNEHYRDSQLQSEAAISVASGVDATTSTTLQNVSWEKDYFTTSRGSEQLGSTVTIPLGANAEVIGDDSTSEVPLFDYANITNGNLVSTNGSINLNVSNMPNAADNLKWADPRLVADLTNATGIDINDLRMALKLQEFQEARNIYGGRYVEYLKYLGLKGGPGLDGRLQNPEYLGGGSQTIAFSEVLSTDGANTGDMKGHGITAMKTNRYRRFIPEHGIILSLLSVVPKSIYANGLHRHWSKTTKEDYFQRELQHVGEQEVYNKEVYTEHTTPDGIFGYQARYDQYRGMPSNIAGQFHSTDNTWHYARIFASDTALNSTFIAANPTKRVNADSNDALYVMASHSVQARRQLHKTGTPKL